MNKSWPRQVVADTKECGTERDLERKKNAKTRPHCADFSKDRIKLAGWRPRKMGVWAGSPDFTDFAVLEAESFIRKTGNIGGCGRRFLFVPRRVGISELEGASKLLRGQDGAELGSPGQTT